MKDWIRGKKGGKVYGAALRNANYPEGEWLFSFYQTEWNRDRYTKHFSNMEVITFELDVDTLTQK